MDFKREWTQFALDAEVDSFGTGRACKAHNEEVRLLKVQIKELSDLLYARDNQIANEHDKRTHAKGCPCPLCMTT